VVFGGGDFDSLENILRSIPANWKMLEPFIPPLGDLYHPDKFWPSEFGRYCYPEVDYLRDKSDLFEYEMYEKIKAVQVKYQMDVGVASGKFYLTRMDIIGPAFANCHILIARIKEAFDPQNIANPTRVVDISAMKKKGELPAGK
jgi:hypothetical protein